MVHKLDCMIVLMLNCPLLAVKNQATDHLFLNDEGDFPESRTVIEKGVAWEYANNDDMETVQTTGPLKYGVLIMVRMRFISVIITINPELSLKDIQG